LNSEDEQDDDLELIRRGIRSGEVKLGDLLTKHRDRLRRLIELRLDPRVKGRVDASDVIQETQITAVHRIEEYLADPEVPLFVWLRFLALQTVTDAHRRHLGAKARNASREVTIDNFPAASSAALATQLVGQLTTASQALEKVEAKHSLEEAIKSMAPKDREVIVLRHYEQLSQKETARVLGISEAATGSRHVRALIKLRKMLETAGVESP
jgi:RNA polymerase sigma-70 factor (ECF subfamily)